MTTIPARDFVRIAIADPEGEAVGVWYGDLNSRRFDDTLREVQYSIERWIDDEGIATDPEEGYHDAHWFVIEIERDSRRDWRRAYVPASMIEQRIMRSLDLVSDRRDGDTGSRLFAEATA